MIVLMAKERNVKRLKFWAWQMAEAKQSLFNAIFDVKECHDYLRIRL